MNNLGQQIRLIRLQKRIGLNAFAQLLGVSSGYLSNLENGKTDTIQISLLERLIKEFNLTFSTVADKNVRNQFDIRSERSHHLLKQLHSTNPDAAEYLVGLVEQGVDVFNKTS